MKRNYQFEKRQKDLDKKRKQEEKAQRKLDRALLPPDEPVEGAPPVDTASPPEE